MGLFGKAAKGLFSGDVMSKFARAQALANDDYLGAARISSAMQEGELERRKAENEAAGLAQVHAQIDADPGLSPQDKIYAKANPKVYVEQYLSRFKQVEMGPNGGSVGQRNAQGGIDWQRAPSRYEVGRDLIDIDSNGQSKPIYEGVEPVTAPIGNQMYFMRGGKLIASDGSPLPFSGAPAGAPKILTDDDFSPEDIVTRGGAGPSGPRPFR